MFDNRRFGWVGVDVGTSAVKVAQVERSGRGDRIAQALILHEAGYDPLAGLAEGDGWLARNLKTRLQHERRMRGRRSACLLSMRGTQLRPMSLPPGTYAERRAIIAQELEDAPEMRDCELDFWELPSPKPAGGQTVALASAQVISVQRKLADGIAEALDECGLACEVLDSLPTALARSVGMANPSRAELHAVLDWGSSTAMFTVADDGEVVFTRELRNCGIQQVIEAIGQRLRLAPTETQQLLRWYGLPADRATDSARTEIQRLTAGFAAEHLDRLVAELDRTLSYLKQQRSLLIPRHLWLAGGGAMIAGVERYLTERINISVRAWRLSGSSRGPAEDLQPLLASAAALSALAWDS